MKPLALSCSFVALATLLAAQDPAPAPPPQEPPAPAPPQDTPESLAERKRAVQEREAAEYFALCDQNGNGWISLREGQESLGLDATSFASYDADRDGRVTREEFTARYRLTIQQAGAFKRPAAASGGVRAPSRTAEQLRNAYDRNGDGGLSAVEMRLLLADYERTELPAELAVEKLDRDGSTRIDGAEIDFLARLLTTSVSPATADPNSPQVRQSLEELFGGLRDRSAGYQTAPMPPQIDGPVPHFRRLDLDGDGRISIDDLRRLQSPLDLSVRSAAVLAALDADGDGDLSPQEFSRALGGP